MTNPLTRTPPTLANEAVPAQPLAASFFQPVYEAWPTQLDGSWAAWMARLRRCGVRRLIVQHLSHLWMGNGMAATAPAFDILLGPSEHTQDGLGGWSAAEALLQAADQVGMRIDVGLSTFMPQGGAPAGRAWDWLSQRATTRELMPWLQRAAAADQRIAQAWHARFGSRQGFHAAWRGWYLPNELDDLSWQAPGSREAWVAHLQSVIQYLRDLDGPAPGLRRPIAVSGFANVATPLDTVSHQWQGWLSDLPVDEVLFQDTMGAKQQPTWRVVALYARVAAAAASQGRCFTPVVELFREQSARSASVAEAAEGLQLAVAAGSRGAQDDPPGWICFDVPHDVIGRRPGAEALSARFEAPP